MAALKTALVALFICLAISSTVDAAQVSLVWDPNSAVPDGYHIFKRTEGQVYDYHSAAWSGTGTTATISNLTDNTTYYFVVRAFVVNGESGDSNEVEYRTGASTTTPLPADSGADSVIVIDDGQAGTSSTGRWILSGGTNPYGAQSLYSKQSGAKYTYASQLSGRYEVAMWWTGYSSRCSDVPVEIYDGNILLDTLYVDQRQDGGQWNVLGSYDFTGRARIEVLARSSSCSTCADAVEFSQKNSDGDQVTDSDGDGVIDSLDVFPFNKNEWIDTDGDGIGNNTDTDDDGDGMPDDWENLFGLNPMVEDAWQDLDGDGVDNINEYNSGTNPSNTDSDGDGYNDYKDDFPLDNTKWNITDGIDPGNEGDSAIVIDDGQPGTSSTGSWHLSGGTNPYGKQSLYSKEPGARYAYASQLSGRYEVAIWWTAYSSRCSDVPIEIYDGNMLLDTVYVDQMQNGGQWNVLGSYDFTGQARVVVVARDSSCSTSADAIAFSADHDDGAKVIDDGQPGTSSTGRWILSGGTNPYGKKSLYSKEPGARYAYASQLSGRYEVAIWWTAYSSRCPGVPIEIYDGNMLLDTVYVDQMQDGGQWNVLGSYDFTGQARVVVLAKDSGCSTCADALLFSK